jgi:outer membrane protein
VKARNTFAAIAALACVTTAHAQSAGSMYVTTGWFHLAPQTSSGPLTITSPAIGPIPDTGAGVNSADTLGLSAGYFITDHIAVEFESGIPPKFDITGEGALSSFGTLGSAKQWSPALLLKYSFFDPQAKFRPYVGIGATYVWFSDAKITNNAFLGTLGGPTSVSTNSSLAPVFNVGFNYAFTKHWFAGFSVSYIPVSVKATLQSTTPVGPVTSEAKIKLDPIVTYLKVGYSF